MVHVHPSLARLAAHGKTQTPRGRVTHGLRHSAARATEVSCVLTRYCDAPVTTDVASTDAASRVVLPE